jgi:hypothetical protein
LILVGNIKKEYWHLEEWGIPGLLTISLDNASANNTTVDCFKKRTMANNGVICRHEFIHVRCCAHIINLIVHKGIERCR